MFVAIGFWGCAIQSDDRADLDMARVHEEFSLLKRKDLLVGIRSWQSGGKVSIYNVDNPVKTGTMTEPNIEPLNAKAIYYIATVAVDSRSFSYVFAVTSRSVALVGSYENSGGHLVPLRVANQP